MNLTYVRLIDFNCVVKDLIPIHFHTLFLNLRTITSFSPKYGREFLDRRIEYRALSGVLYGGEEGRVDGRHLGREEGVHTEQQALKDLTLQLLETDYHIIC